MLTLDDLEQKFYQNKWLSSGKPIEGDNLFPNPSVEVDTASIDSTATQATISSSADAISGWPINGTKSLKMVAGTGLSTGAARQKFQNRLAANPGDVFSASAWFRNATGVARECILYIRFYDALPTDVAAGNTLATVTSGTVSYADGQIFKLVVENAVAPAGTQSVGLLFIWNNAAVLGEIVYVDSIMLNRGPVVNSYFDGNSIKSSWSGIPHNSLSSFVDSNTKSENFLELDFWSKTSGLVPADKFSISDHQLASLRISEASGGSMSDLLRSYYSRQSGLPVGRSLADHKYQYFRTQLGV